MSYIHINFIAKNNFICEEIGESYEQSSSQFQVQLEIKNKNNKITMVFDSF